MTRSLSAITPTTVARSCRPYQQGTPAASNNQPHVSVEDDPQHGRTFAESCKTRTQGSKERPCHADNCCHNCTGQGSLLLTASTVGSCQFSTNPACRYTRRWEVTPGKLGRNCSACCAWLGLHHKASSSTATGHRRHPVEPPCLLRVIAPDKPCHAKLHFLAIWCAQP